MKPKELKQHILQLADQAHHIRAHLDTQRYVGFSMGHCSCHVCVEERRAALAADLDALISQGRAALFDLYVSGISHNDYIRFVEEHSHARV